jgi:hypothetical protein
MKTFTIILSAIAVTALLWFSSCGDYRYPIWMESIVYPDGQIDKVISYKSDDSTQWYPSINLLEDLKDWRTDITIDTFYYTRQRDSLGKETEDSVKHEVYRKTFSRRFRSTEEANQALASPNDTLFRMTSRFEKKFRWFYTYIRYADTYHAIWRLPHTPEDYLTPEDYAFIKRLPSDEKELSKADVLFLKDLEKKQDELIELSLFEALYKSCEQLIKEGGLEDRWIDSLKIHKGGLYNLELLTFNEKGNYNYVLDLMDSLGISLPKDREYQQWKENTKHLNNVVDLLLLSAAMTSYNHNIKLPTEIFFSNADSVKGDKLFWYPRYHKFLFNDYTMYAESRKLNYWAIMVTVIFAGIFVYLVMRKMATY